MSDNNNTIKPDTLSPDQERAWLEITQFAAQKGSGHMEHALSGSAGTGKSYLISRLVPYLEESGHSIHLTATTNQAAEVISRMSSSYDGEPAGTIHSLLGLQPVDNYETGKTDLKQVRESKVSHNSIVICDEASMAQRDLLEVVRTACASVSAKVLWVGDAYQLPPVFEKESPVFAEVQSQSHLITPQRQAVDSPIIQTATSFRETISGSPFRYIESNPPGVVRLSHEDFEVEMVKAFVNKEDVKALAWTNRRVRAMNTIIRNRMLDNPSMKFMAGEDVVVNKAVTQWNRETRETDLVLRTNEKVHITESSATTDKNGITGYNITVTRDLSQRDRDFGAPRVVKFFTPENFDDTKALLADLRKTALTVTGECKNLTNSGQSVPPQLETQRRRAWGAFFGAERSFVDIRPIYASTVHKAQGSGFAKVFIDLNDIGQNKKWYEVARLVYVALSRGKEQVYVTGDLREQVYGLNGGGV